MFFNDASTLFTMKSFCEDMLTPMANETVSTTLETILDSGVSNVILLPAATPTSISLSKTDRVDALNKEAADLDARQETLLLSIPNLPHEACPVGESAEENPEVRVWGTKPVLAFEPKDHVALGTELKMLDFEAGVKLSEDLLDGLDHAEAVADDLVNRDLADVGERSRQAGLELLDHPCGLQCEESGLVELEPALLVGQGLLADELEHLRSQRHTLGVSLALVQIDNQTHGAEGNEGFRHNQRHGKFFDPSVSHRGA